MLLRVVVVTRPLPKDGGMAENHGSPEVTTSVTNLSQCFTKSEKNALSTV